VIQGGRVPMRADMEVRLQAKVVTFEKDGHEFPAVCARVADLAQSEHR
jgi:hypothetical protein